MENINLLKLDLSKLNLREKLIISATWPFVIFLYFIRCYTFQGKGIQHAAQ